jgi:tRNA(Ile)-lysidine synthase
MPLRDRVVGSFRRCGFASARTRVMVALSGGADSVALLHLVCELQAAGALTLAGTAHLHHGLRGADADEDQAFCARLAERLGVAFVTDRVDVAALARMEKRSVEDAARTARYTFLERAADTLAADAIATAHTRDDQAETFLLRLLRGAGTRGLGGIRPRAGRVVRPLLDVERAELRRYLAGRAEGFREDASNADPAILRNRVRHELLPYLESRFSPGITDVLAREASLAQEDEDFLRRQTIETARGIVLTDNSTLDESLQIDARALRSVHPAVASRVAHDVLSRLAGSRPIGFDHVRRLFELAADGRERGSLSLPGQHAERRGDVIVLRPGRSDRREPNSFAFALSIPGEVESAPHGWAIRADRMEALGLDSERLVARGPEVAVAAGALILPLSVRNRRPGDRFRPIGAPGARKLQDFLVDRKVPRSDRDTLPLVVDGQDRIVWVVGQSVAEGFRVLDPSQGVIFLKVKRLGGPG